MAEDMNQSALGAGVPSDTPKTPIQGPSPLLKKYISNGMKLIHTPAMSAEVVKQLKGDNDIEALSNLSLRVIDSLDVSAKGTLGKIPDEIKWQGAAVLMDQLVQVGKAAGVMDLNEQQIKEAAGNAVGKYIQRGIGDGSITEDQLREAYKIIQANNPGQQVMFDPSQTPGVADSSTPIPRTSPGPSALGGM